MVNLEQHLASAFTLLGGSDHDGLTLAQLHKGICSGQRSIPQKFLDELSELMGLNDKVSSNSANKDRDKDPHSLPVFVDESENNDIIDFDVLSLQKSCDDIFSSSEYEDSCSDSEPSSLTD